jgi:hypothetical protein
MMCLFIFVAPLQFGFNNELAKNFKKQETGCASTIFTD